MFFGYCYRKNHQRQLEALQQSLEEETKAKNEQSRQKKVADAQLNDLQGELDATVKVRGKRKNEGSLCVAQSLIKISGLNLRVSKIKIK